MRTAPFSSVRFFSFYSRNILGQHNNNSRSVVASPWMRKLGNKSWPCINPWSPSWGDKRALWIVFCLVDMSHQFFFCLVFTSSVFDFFHFPIFLITFLHAYNSHYHTISSSTSAYLLRKMCSISKIVLPTPLFLYSNIFTKKTPIVVLKYPKYNNYSYLFIVLFGLITCQNLS